MFPHCANPDCTATFGNFKEGAFFRFRRSYLEGEAPAKNHLVEHCWLCKNCSEEYTLDYRENRSILISLIPAIALPPEPVRVSKPARRPRAKRRPRDRRGGAPPMQKPHGSSLLILAVPAASDKA
jgi:hypothetical protein